MLDIIHFTVTIEQSLDRVLPLYDFDYYSINTPLSFPFTVNDHTYSDFRNADI